MNYFNQAKFNQEEIANTQKILKSKSIVDVTHFFAQDFIENLIQETVSVYEQKLQRKDFLMEQTDNTPRNMFAVSERAIDACATMIPKFYYEEEVLHFFSTLAQEPVIPLPWTGERYVINGLSRSNDTHGWHWDDYAYALVFIAKAPKLGNGGEVECIADTFWNREKPNIEQILQQNQKQVHHFESGSFYLMKSDTSLHRVAPITAGEIRIAIAISFCNKADLSKDLDHQTVYELYGV